MSIPPTVLQKFHARYGTSKLVHAHPSRLSLLLEREDVHPRVQFLAACLSHKVKKVKKMAGRKAIDCPYVFYSVVEACCQRGVLGMAKIISLDLLCVKEYSSLIFFENLIARGCLEASKWWYSCVKPKMGVECSNLIGLVGINARLEMWHWLREIAPDLTSDLQLLVFGKALEYGQLGMAEKLLELHPGLDPLANQHHIYASLVRNIQNGTVESYDTLQWLLERAPKGLYRPPCLVSREHIHGQWAPLQKSLIKHVPFRIKKGYTVYTLTPKERVELWEL